MGYEKDLIGWVISGGVSFFVVILFFLFLREFWCWYLKQSVQVELLQEIRDLLKGDEINAPKIHPDDSQVTDSGKTKRFGNVLF